MPCQPCEVRLLVRTHASAHRQEPFAGPRSHACRKENLEASGTVRIIGFLDFVHRPVFCKLENTTFRELDLFPSSGEGEGGSLRKT
jgi:hypothetical protein